MIRITEKETIVQLGYGTVRIRQAGTKQKDAFLGFKTQEPEKIGSYITHNLKEEPSSLGEPEVVLAFKNVESLDVVIEELQFLKQEIFGTANEKH